MSKINPHEFFNTRKDYTKWDNFVEQIDSINLSDSDKQRARSAIEYLRTILGKSFFADIIQNGHPLFSYYFINAANLARIQMIHFAESLQALEKSPNFHTVVDKIRKARKFSEGSTILEAAHKFHKADFLVAFDEKVTFTDGGKLKSKKPDIKITNRKTKENIYIEVSEVGKSQIDIDNGRTYETLYFLIHDTIHSDPELMSFANPKHILPYVRILRTFNELELTDIIERIKQLINKVRNTGEFQELIIEGMIEIGISPFHDHSMAEKWAEQRNIKDFVESPPFNPNELNRAVNRLNEELEQLPTDKPGIVILWNNANLLFFLHDIPSIINKIADKIADFPHIFGVALNYDYGWKEAGTSYVEIGNHLFVSNTGRDLITRNTLLVQNEIFNLALTNSTKEKLRKAFINSTLDTD